MAETILTRMNGVNARSQSFGEEIANSITHGAALLASIAAIPLLLLASSGPGDAWQIVGVVIFGVALVLLYLASTAYHAMKAGRAKRILRVLDHSAIYILIAGTYTPFALGVLRGPWGWALLGTAWTLALLGIAAKCTVGFRFSRLSTVLYLGMGWMALAAAGPLIEHVSAAGLAWLIAGGLCYTGGVFFYSADGRIRYGHALWHLFVIAGSTCHFFAVLWHSAAQPS